MTAIRFHSRLYLYWYNRSDWSIYSYDVAAGAVAVHVELEEGTIINSLDSHDGPTFDDGKHYFIYSYFICFFPPLFSLLFILSSLSLQLCLSVLSLLALIFVLLSM